MASFLKWVGGGIGWAVGGPIGAIIGFAIGSMISGKATPADRPSIGTKQTTEGDFKVSLLVLMAVVMKADGKVKRSELNVVKRFLTSNFGDEDALEALQVFKKILDSDIDEVAVAQQINMHMNHPAKLELIRLLFDIAYADGEVHPNELAVIQRIAVILHISRIEFDALKALYIKNEDVNWAYKALEIESNATNDEIKKAYRKMAMKYHPDRVASLGEDVKNSATKKFQGINEAYEHLKKERGII